MKIYVAGPMSGIPQFNYPAFDAATDIVRKHGHDPINPAEMDSDEMRAIALASKTGLISELKDTGETWGDLLSRDVKIVADVVDGVALLPGWLNSRGARLEAYVALTVQKPLFEVIGRRLIRLDPQEAIHEIACMAVDQGDVSRYASG